MVYMRKNLNNDFQGTNMGPLSMQDGPSMTEETNPRSLQDVVMRIQTRKRPSSEYNNINIQSSNNDTVIKNKLRMVETAIACNLRLDGRLTKARPMLTQHANSRMQMQRTESRMLMLHSRPIRGHSKIM